MPESTAQVMSHDDLLQFFAYDHLPDHLQKVSGTFWTLANYIVTQLPDNPERAMALRKLLEAKDCAVRAKLFKPRDDMDRIDEMLARSQP